jgi:hypothetical protein
VKNSINSVFFRHAPTSRIFIALLNTELCEIAVPSLINSRGNREWVTGRSASFPVEKLVRGSGKPKTKPQSQKKNDTRGSKSVLVNAHT